MSSHLRRKTRKSSWLICSAIAVLSLSSPVLVQAQTRQVAFAIESQPLDSALQAFARVSGIQLMYSPELVKGKRAKPVSGQMAPEAALKILLSGSGIQARSLDANGRTWSLTATAKTEKIVSTNTSRPAAPKAAPKPVESVGDSGIQEVIVTARRKEEKIIDVPVAVSAFTAKQLDDRKVEGGAELLRVIPNVNFSKDNFTGYNFSIRGIGTKAIATTVDPAVAISFNNTTLLRNRLFEQEYFDVQRLEVLRGPQGTLYGRNATAGVVNMLPNQPELGDFNGEVQIEGGNFESRRVNGFVNIPLGEKFAVRVAGAMTQRDGYDYNTVTEHSVNGRDLWSTRVGLRWEPTPNFRANLLWEHFNEDDDRSRTGKQLCTRASAPDTVEYTLSNGQRGSADVWTMWSRSTLTPGCQAKSLFSDEAFGVADSFGSPMVTGLLMISPYRALPGGEDYFTDEYIDPFNTGDGTQSRNLREIATIYDPVFRAKNDVFQLNLEYDLKPGLTLYSQTLYMKDSYYGSQDGMRSQPASGILRKVSDHAGIDAWYDMRIEVPGETYRFGLSGEDTEYGAIFCDPQLGCADHALSVDIASAESKQFSQEFRLTSTFDGPFNFNLGANYLKYETQEDYYALSNLLTIIAMGGNAGSVGEERITPYRTCGSNVPGVGSNCMYIDPNPIESMDGEGHNYYRSIGISTTKSWAVFGEAYINLRENLRLTAGLRYTNDEKTVTPVPTQLLASTGFFNGSTGSDQVVSKGFIYEPDESYDYGEWTGRLALDWKPELPFTDQTLVYASYSRGYKAGSNNPYGQYIDPENPSFSPLPRGFNPEFVNAFEIGTKNALLGGRAMFSVTGFYYDYTDYQVSQILDRGFHTENFDARVLGLELEGSFRVTHRLRIDGTLGYLNTAIGKGEKSIDVMNRTAGNDDWMVVRPWATSPYTCIVPKDIVGRIIAGTDGPNNPDATASQRRGSAFTMRSLCPGGILGNIPLVSEGGSINWDPINDSQGGGRGFYTELGGNELPNSPSFTFNIGAEYRFDLPSGWGMTVRGDYYRQSDSYMRVYNSEYDKLKGWGNANLSATFVRSGSPFRAQIYVKNLFDDTPITDGFTGPDELGNFTNVFTLDPRIIGLSLRAAF